MEVKELAQRLSLLEAKIDHISAVTEITKRYFVLSALAQLALVLVPLLILLFVLPFLLSTVSRELEGLLSSVL